MDVALLSRIQFAFTVGFHIIWPTLSIGLIAFLVFFEGMWLYTKSESYLRLYKFWVKIFALSFGMGVVTGFPLAYQFGTNFSVLSDYAGGVIGPLMSVEVMTAFFIEATSIGIMLFGFGRVPKWMHFMATCLVALGTHNSTLWIMATNAWMQTPAGVTEEGGRLVITSLLDAVFNPSFFVRMTHMLLACYVTASVVICGTSAWLVLNKKSSVSVQKGLKISLVAMSVLIVLQIIMGDVHGLNTLKYQPAKIAAIEGLWETTEGAPLVLFAIPDQKAQTNKYAIEIPYVTSLILTHDLKGKVVGLKDLENTTGIPYVPIVFYSFRIMVGCGILILLLNMYGMYIWRRGDLMHKTMWHKVMQFAVPLGFISTITGWIVAETGRQPWVIYGMLQTVKSVSPIPSSNVLFSLIAFVIVYTSMFVAFIYYSRSVIHNAFFGDDHPEPWLELATHTVHLTPKEVLHD